MVGPFGNKPIMEPEVTLKPTEPRWHSPGWLEQASEKNTPITGEIPRIFKVLQQELGVGEVQIYISSHTTQVIDFFWFWILFSSFFFMSRTFCELNVEAMDFMIFLSVMLCYI